MVIERAEGQTLGLGLHQIGESVAINEIKPDGAVKAHNAANPSAPVALHDVLRSINGSGSTMGDIIAAVKAAGGSPTLTLELERRPMALVPPVPPPGAPPPDFPPLGLPPVPPAGLPTADVLVPASSVPWHGKGLGPQNCSLASSSLRLCLAGRTGSPLSTTVPIGILICWLL